MPLLTRRGFLRTAAISSFGLGSFGYLTSRELKALEVRQVPLRLPRLDAPFDGYRVAQISDIHLDTGFGEEWLHEIVRMTNEQQPDLITVTGDFVTHRLTPYDNQLIKALSLLKARDGVVAILGNHDHWTDPVGVKRIISRSGMMDLNNDVYTLKRGMARFHISGVDDIWMKKQRLDKVLAMLPEQGAAILLAHEPDFADASAATGRFDLQISGHTHGAQIDVAGKKIFAWMLPPYGRIYIDGLYQVGEMLQYTNRGVGLILPFRYHCRPEITLYTFEAGRGA